MVEVAKHDFDTLIFYAKDVGMRDENVFELDVGCSGSAKEGSVNFTWSVIMNIGQVE